jgi:hypothetical protein
MLAFLVRRETLVRPDFQVAMDHLDFLALTANQVYRA